MASKTNTNVLERTKTSTKTKEKHKVIMHNDNTTSFDCVIKILIEVFGKTESEAVGIAMAIHLAGPSGSKVVKEYSSLSLANAKAKKGMQMAADEGYPDFKISTK